MPRSSISNFEIANPLYANALVYFYTVANGLPTATLASLYQGTTGSTPLANPQRLSSEGRFKQPVYIDAPVIGRVTGLSVSSHDTGIITPAPSFRVDQTTGKLQYSFDGGTSWSDSGQYIFKDRGAWAQGVDYYSTDLVQNGGTNYYCKTAHTSGAVFDASKFVTLFSLDLGTLPGGTAFQLRRGTTAAHAAFTGAAGEVTVDTDKKTAVVHDGATAGGIALARATGETFTGTITMSASQFRGAKANNITAASSVDLGTAAGNYVVVELTTGTVNLVSFGTVQAGTALDVRFSVTPGAAINLVHHATQMNLPTGANIAVETGDRARVVSDGSGNWTVTSYLRATGVPLGAAATLKVPVRQTVLSASLDSSGYSNALYAGTGLRLSLRAASAAMVMAFAAGFDANGAVDLVERQSADVVDVTQADLSASNTSFIAKDYGGNWNAYLIPPQDGYAFDRGEAALLNFQGTDGSTTILDDFGNTWTVGGNAQLDTAQYKFGSSSLLLDGTGDYVESTSFTSLGDGSWSISVWVRWNALPGGGGTHYILSAAKVSTGYGVLLYCTESGGTVTTRFHVSSNGSSWDIVNGAAGSTTMTAGVWYRLRVAFDALAGTYRSYVSTNGGAEVQQSSTSSAAKVCAIDKVKIGENFGGANAFNGWIGSFRFLRCVTNTSTETPSASMPTITDYPVHFFSIPDMKMYEVTAASVSAGANPTLTARNRLFVGEADTNGSAVTAVRNYALRGQYDSGLVAKIPTTQTVVNFNHNIGTKHVEYTPYVECIGPGTSSFVVGQRTRWYAYQGGVGASLVETNTMSRNSARYQTGYNDTYLLDANGGGWGTVSGSANFKYGLAARRSF